MSELRVIEIGEDGDRWFVPHAQSVEQAKFAVVRLVAEQLGDDDTLADVIRFVLDAPASLYSRVYIDSDEQLRIASMIEPKKLASWIGEGVMVGNYRIPQEGV